jgi:hypothetical protein
MLVENFQQKRGELYNQTAPITHTLTITEQTVSAGWCTQFSAIFMRCWLNEFRQPLDVILKVFQSIFFGIICIVLYYQKGTTIA